MTPKQIEAFGVLSERPQLLWDLVDRTGDCWLWTGSANEDGYGSVRVGPTSILAHRAAYLLRHGIIPDGLCVCHSCDTPPCCNPSHLFLDSHRGNMGDMKSKGRRKGVGAGAENGRAKLTLALVNDIRLRRSSGDMLSEIARDYCVGSSTISRACRGENWK